MVTPGAPADDVLRRAAAGARLLTTRGAGMRAVSVVTNFALIALVAPAGLGLLAVVRGVTGLAGNGSDLGFAWALLRRPTRPTDAEYAAMAGLQYALIAAGLVVALAFPHQIAAFAVVPAGMAWWMTGVLLTLVTLPAGTGGRIRLERAMDYRRLAFLDFSSVLLQNLLLLGFALSDRFAIGVFVAMGATTLYTNLLLVFWSPGPRATFHLAEWSSLGREFAGFSAGHLGSMLGASMTPVLIAHLLGLPVAGIWSFAVRLGNVVQLTFEGFRRAAIPAAANLADRRDQLARLVQDTLDGAARLTLPMVAILIAVLPVVGWLLPNWAAAVIPAQLFVLGYGLSGLLGAALVPAVVALRGARAVLTEQFVPLLVVWAGVALLAWWQRSDIAWVILAMHAATAAALWRIAERDVRPGWNAALRPVTGALIAAIVACALGSLARFHPVITTLLTTCSALAAWRFAVPSIRGPVSRNATTNPRYEVLP